MTGILAKQHAPQEEREAASVRETVRALFARLLAASAPDAGEAPEGPSEPDPRRHEEALRRRAHLAYSTVRTAGPNAVDVALDVVLAEVAALNLRAHRQAEALKTIRLYAPTPWVRHLAEEGLAAETRPEAPRFLRCGDADAEADEIRAAIFRRAD